MRVQVQRTHWAAQSAHALSGGCRAKEGPAHGARQPARSAHRQIKEEDGGATASVSSFWPRRRRDQISSQADAEGGEPACTVRRRGISDLKPPDGR